MTHPITTLNKGQTGRLGARLLAIALVALGLVSLFSAGRASAVVIRPEIATFGPDGTSGSSFTENGALTLDRNTQSLFVANGGANPGIFGFDASSSFPLPVLGGFSPLSAPTPALGGTGLAVDETALSSSGNIYYSLPGFFGEAGSVYGFDKTGTPLGGNFPINPRLNPGPSTGLAGDICDPAVDSSGNLWVANYGLARVLKYNSAGVFQSSVSTSPQKTNPCDLAFDSNDDLYVGASSFPTWKYTAASGYSVATKFDNRHASAIAVDPVTHHVFITHARFEDPADITEFDESGAVVSRFATEIPEAASNIPNLYVTSLAFDPGNDRLYAFDAGNGGKVRVFGTGLTYPDLTLGSASAIENTTATVDGTISALSVPLTDCRFQYVAGANFAVSGFTDLSSGGSAPCTPAAGSIPADSATHPVSAAVGGLSASTAYRFRLVAANANGSIATVDAGSFETTGPALVETFGSPVRTTTTARLDGQISPQGAAATYHFEYGDQGPCDSNPCTSTEPHPAGSGSVFELVSQQIGGLQPNTTYHYRVIADNGNPIGQATGEDRTVTTRGEEAPLSHGHLPGPVGSDRAWELVSAPDTGGNPVGTSFAPGAASISDTGDRAVYGVAGGTPLSETGTVATRLFAERTPSGWVTKKIYAPREEATGVRWQDPGGPTDLSSMVVENENEGKGGEFSIWRLSPEAAPVRLFGGNVEIRAEGMVFGLLLASEDGSRAVISLRGSQDPAHPATAEAKNLYDISSGQPQMVNLLPDGTVPVCGVEQNLNSGAGIYSNADRSSRWVSADGSLLFFPSKGSNCSAPLRLYVRDIEAETTKLISTPPVSGPECDTDFIKSIPGAAYFYTQSRLVAKDTEPEACSESSPSGDIYRYDPGDGSLDCLTCIAPDAQAGVMTSSNAISIDQRIGIAEDGSRVYFASSKRLLAGAAKTRGVYRLNVASGLIAYVGSFDSFGDVVTGSMNPDGSVVVFRSSAPSLNALGGQQNGGTSQYYRYDDRDRSLLCVSCPAGGSVPRGGIEGGMKREGPGANSGPLSADGNIFAFVTPTPLAAADQNTAPAGQDARMGTDVYEWRDGALLLVSDGLTNWPFEETPNVSGITPSGHDIFFTAAAQYTPNALDGYKRLYDARIGGGFEFPRPPKPCSLEVCQGTPKGAPEEQAPGTATIKGAGNASRPGRTVCAKPKRKVRRGGKTRCVKPARNKHGRQQTNHNRRAAR